MRIEDFSWGTVAILFASVVTVGCMDTIMRQWLNNIDNYVPQQYTIWGFHYILLVTNSTSISSYKLQPMWLLRYLKSNIT